MDRVLSVLYALAQLLLQPVRTANPALTSLTFSLFSTRYPKDFFENQSVIAFEFVNCAQELVNGVKTISRCRFPDFSVCGVSFYMWLSCLQKFYHEKLNYFDRKLEIHYKRFWKYELRVAS